MFYQNYLSTILRFFVVSSTAILFVAVTAELVRSQDNEDGNYTEQEQDFFRFLSDQLHQSRRKYSELTRSKSRSRQQIALYIRGKQGVAFPDQETLTAAREKALNTYREQLTPVISELYRVSQPSPDPRPIPVRTCAFSKTDKTSIKQKRRGKKQTKAPASFFDVLITQKQFIPTEFAKAFGRNVIVKVYDRDQKSLYNTALQFNSSHVPCLPYRIRLTSKHRYTHYGKDALLNYDQTPDGKGKLSPDVQKLIGLEGW